MEQSLKTVSCQFATILSTTYAQKSKGKAKAVYLHDQQRKNDIQRRPAHNGNAEVDNPDDSLDRRGYKVENWVELVGDCEADFDEREQQAEACDCHDDGTTGTVGGGRLVG